MYSRRPCVASAGVMVCYQDGACAAGNGQTPEKWVDEIEQVLSVPRMQAVPRPALRRVERHAGTDPGPQDLWPRGCRPAARHFAGVAGVSDRVGRVAADEPHGGRTQAVPLLPCSVDDGVPAVCRQNCRTGHLGQAAMEGIGCASCHLIKVKHQWPAAHVQDRAGEDHARPLRRSGREPRP